MQRVIIMISCCWGCYCCCCCCCFVTTATLSLLLRLQNRFFCFCLCLVPKNHFAFFFFPLWISLRVSVSVSLTPQPCVVLLTVVVYGSCSSCWVWFSSTNKGDPESMKWINVSKSPKFACFFFFFVWLRERESQYINTLSLSFFLCWFLCLSSLFLLVCFLSLSLSSLFFYPSILDYTVVLYFSVHSLSLSLSLFKIKSLSSPLAYDAIPVLLLFFLQWCGINTPTWPTKFSSIKYVFFSFYGFYWYNTVNCTDLHTLYIHSVEFISSDDIYFIWGLLL